MISKIRNIRHIVIPYTNSDLDGFACAVAYAEFLNNNKKMNARAFIFGAPSSETNWILDVCHITHQKTLKNTIHSNDSIILVDASDTKGIHASIFPKKVIEVIDHRKINDSHLFQNAKIQIEPVGAAATLIAEKFIRAHTRPTRESAILLYGAIISNTLNFKAKVTTKRDKQAAKWLNGILKLPKTFAYAMFKAKSNLKDKKLKTAMAHNFARFDIRNKKFGICQLEIIGAKKLMQYRKKEILQCLKSLKKKNRLDFVFMSILDLEKNINIFVSNDDEAKNLLAKIFHVHFADAHAVRRGLIMRKEIIPRVYQHLK